MCYIQQSLTRRTKQYTGPNRIKHFLNSLGIPKLFLLLLKFM